MDKNRRFSLKTLNIVMIIIAASISAVLFYAMLQTSKINNDADHVTQDLISSKNSAYELQVASDYLTEQVRCFVITGDKEYLDNYFEEAKTTRRRDNALSELEKQYGGSEAFNNLSGAMAESTELMQSEYYAMRLAVDAYGYDISDFPEEIQAIKPEDWTAALTPEEKKNEAEKILFGNDYQKRKNSISKYMQSCLAELDAEMVKVQSEAAARLDHQVFFEHLLTILLIAVLLGNVLITSLLVIMPVRKCVKLINDGKEIPEKGAYEIAFLAHICNKSSSSKS